MKFIKTEIPEVVIIEPKVFEDERGYFFESFNQKEFDENIGNVDFVQDNESKSSYGIVRGLHYQLPTFNQQKLVRVIEGTVLDVAVDIRKDSPTFGKHVAVELSAKNKRQLWVPKGFAHGFAVLTETAIFSYKVDNYYAPEYDRGVLWNDPEIGIDWKVDVDKVQLSGKDENQPKLNDVKDLL
ncbi:MAG: dTDP-4-dehydrorhamnose 3,5-epimerase [Fibrobacterales bacterium]